MSTSLSLGYAERRMSESWTETSETSKHRILMNLNIFRNFMSAMLDPLYGILKIQFEIRNQRPQKPPSTELCENRRVSEISCPPYWTRQFEIWKSDVKFAISDLRNLWVQSSTKIVGFPKYCLAYWVRDFEFRKSDVKFVISDLKSLGVRSSTNIVGFPKYYVRHIGSAILKSENPMSNS